MENKSKKYFTTFQVSCNSTKIGDDLFVVGSTPCLGSWKPSNGLKLNTNEQTFPVWKSKVQEIICEDDQMEYKYLIKSNHHEIWENFEGNRILKLREEVDKLAKYHIEFTVEVHDEKFGVNKKPRIFIGPFKEKLSEITEDDKTQKSESHFDYEKPDNKVEKESIKTLIRKKSLNDMKLSEDQHQKRFEYKSSSNLKISGYLENLISTIVKLNDEKKSWKDKLSLVWELLSNKSQEDLDKEFLSLIAIYLFFVNSGQIKCSEDGTHFRPNHHAGLAFNVFTFLLKNINDENGILIRSILKNLPSFADQYMVSVPLTRIRDIAHRNDIPRDLKEEIKRTLQNKLHRSASPDDLKTAENILSKITQQGANYSHDFVKEFKIFYEELKEFFNAMGLEKTLQRLKEILSSCKNVNFSCHHIHEQIDKVLREKHEDIEKTLNKLDEINKLRKMLVEITHEELANENKQNKTLLQLSSSSEIELEKFSYTLISQYIDKYYYNNNKIKEQGYQNLLTLSLLCLDSLLMSDIKREECELIKNDLIHYTINFVFESYNDKEKHRLTLLKLKAIFERCMNIFYEITEDVEKYFTTPVYALGKALNLNPHSIRVFSESFIRGHTIFQFSKITTLLLYKIRDMLNLPPYTTISSGIKLGYFLHLEKLSDFVPEKYEHKEYVVFLNESDGSEEIPNEIKAIILSHDLPQLSHLAIRARQNKVAFICCLDHDLFKYKLYKQFKTGDYLKVWVESDNLKLELSSQPEIDGTNHKVDEEENNSKKQDFIEEVDKEFDEVSPDTDEKKSGKIFGGLLDISEAEKKIAGSKCSNMLNLVKLKSISKIEFFTPLSFCIPYSVYEKYVHQCLSDSDYQTIDTCASEELEPRCNEIREKFIHKVLAIKEKESDLKNSIDYIADQIILKLPLNSLLAIRSSSNLEDLKKSAGAGLFDSYLGIANNQNNKEEIKHNICKVWASLFTLRGIIARRNNKIPSAMARMGILVQEMIDPQFSFVIHTVNPITQDQNEVYIELANGMGETLASAKQRGSPYKIVYKKNEDQIIITNYASFSFSIKNGINQQVISYKDEKLSNDDEYLHNIGSRLGKISIELESFFNGVPQDVEGCVYNDQIYLMQTRPQIL
jgi:phosphoglucan, water dikinase